MASEPDESVRTGAVRVGPLRLAVGHWAYGTVTLLSVLVVFDGWKNLDNLADVLLVMTAPALALALAHLFAEALERHIHVGRSLRRAEWRELVADSAQFLLILVPPVAVLLVCRLLGVQMRTTVAVILWFGVASLGFWGWLAGRRAALHGWRLVAATFAGLSIGLVVICLQLLLKPH